MDQLTLSFEPGLARRHRSLLECCHNRITKTGQSNVAPVLDWAPSNLSVALAGKPDAGQRKRKFGVDDLERYIQEFEDFEPIYYLIDKFLKDKDVTQKQLIARAVDAVGELQELIAGLKDQ